MGMKNELTSEQKSTIIYGFKRNDSYRTIANYVGCSKSVVGNIINRFIKTGSTEPAQRTGRPRLLNTRARTTLKKLATNKKNRHSSNAELTNLFISKTQIKVSERTIRRALHEKKLRSRVARPKPLVSEKNIEGRLRWCLDHKDWTVNDFKKVIWSDESTFTQFQRGSKYRVWHEPHEEWNIDCVSETVGHSPSHMHWGCFSWFGVGPIIPLCASVTGSSSKKKVEQKKKKKKKIFLSRLPFFFPSEVVRRNSSGGSSSGPSKLSYNQVEWCWLSLVSA
jgi:transposase